MTAVRLLWISFALGVATWYLGSVRDPDFGFLPPFVAVMLVAFLFSAALNVLVYRGRNWARIVTLVLFLVTIVMVFIPAEEPDAPSALENGLTLISLVLDVAALYLLFTRPGASWFRRDE